MPTPCLITHYLLNDPGRRDQPGALRAARPARIARGSAAGARRQLRGRRHRPPRRARSSRAVRRDVHRAVEAIAAASRSCLHEATHDEQGRADAARDGARRDPRSAGRRSTVFHDAPEPLEAAFVCAAAASRCAARGAPAERDRQFRSGARASDFDYVMLFESSGMYNGEDIAASRRTCAWAASTPSGAAGGCRCGTSRSPIG